MVGKKQKPKKPRELSEQQAQLRQMILDFMARMHMNQVQLRVAIGLSEGAINHWVEGYRTPNAAMIRFALDGIEFGTTQLCVDARNRARKKKWVDPQYRVAESFQQE